MNHNILNIIAEYLDVPKSKLYDFDYDYLISEFLCNALNWVRNNMNNPFDPMCKHAIPTSYSDRFMCGLRTEMSMRCYSCGNICSYKKTHETKFQFPNSKGN